MLRFRADAFDAGAALGLTLTATDAAGRETIRRFPLDAARHGAWLDFFAAVAAEFGTRLPRSRQVDIFGPSAPLRPLLTANLPGMRDGYGDPAVLRVGEEYFLAVTSNDAPDAFPILRSANLTDWTLASFAFPRGSKPAWTLEGEGVADFWAPEIHRWRDGYLLCFAARAADRSLSIGLARADHPAGPWVADDRPILTGGVIDPHIFVGADGAYLFWKEDSNAVWPRLLAALLVQHEDLAAGLFEREADRRTAALAAALWPIGERLEPMEQFFLLQPLIEAAVEDYPGLRIRLQRLAGSEGRTLGIGASHALAAMVTPVFAQRLDRDCRALVGKPQIVLINDLAWEGHLIEGNWVTEQAGRCYLFYSGNDFSTPDYGIGVAVADGPLGPYTKMERPLLKSSAEWWAPGHPSVAAGLDGKPRLFLHAFFPGTGGYREFRALLSARLAFHAERVELLPDQ